MWTIFKQDDGTLVLPEAFIQELGLEEGDRFMVERNEENYVFTRLPKSAIYELRGLARIDHGAQDSLTEALLEERKRERELEEKKYVRFLRHAGVDERRTRDETSD